MAKITNQVIIFEIQPLPQPEEESEEEELESEDVGEEQLDDGELDDGESDNDELLLGLELLEELNKFDDFGILDDRLNSSAS